MGFHRLSTRATCAIAAAVALSVVAADATLEFTRRGSESTGLAGSAGRIIVATASEATDPPGDEGSGQSPVDLYSCPLLHYGSADPVDGMDCVHELQTALRDHGYSRQHVTGLFLNQTRRNVLDFQGRHNLPQTGNFGPLTRKALLGSQTSPTERPESAPPTVSPASYTGHLCSWREHNCSLYLRRTTTRAFAQYLEDHRYSAAAAQYIAGALAEAACRKILKIGRLSIACGVIADRNITELMNALRAARAEDACLRLSVGLPAREGSLRFVAATPDNSSRCTD
jgi:peptidoglycan hydrolase-like protein with peptidoglycan-binding domain